MITLDMFSKSDLLEFSEMFLLKALLIETGMDPRTSLIKIYEIFPCGDLGWIVTEFLKNQTNSTKEEADLFLQAALLTSKPQMKAFYSQLAVGSLTGIASGPNLKIMAAIFRDSSLYQNIGPLEKSKIDDIYSNIEQIIDEHAKWNIQKTNESSYRHLGIIEKSFPLFQESGAHILEWINHFRL